jgi:hypothetical protein
MKFYIFVGSPRAFYRVLYKIVTNALVYANV